MFAGSIKSILTLSHMFSTVTEPGILREIYEIKLFLFSAKEAQDIFFLACQSQLIDLFWLPIDIFKRWGDKKSGFYVNEVVISLISLVWWGSLVNQNSSMVPITHGLWAGYRCIMGRLQVGYRQVMDLTGSLWAEQVGYRSGTLWAGHEPYGQVMGRLWVAYIQVMDLMGRLQVAYGPLMSGSWVAYQGIMGRLQVGHGPYGQVMGSLWAGYRQVTGGLC